MSLSAGWMNRNELVVTDKEATQYHSSTTIARNIYMCTKSMNLRLSQCKLRFTIRRLFVSLQSSKKVIYRIIVYQFNGKLTFCYFFPINNE